MSLKKYWVAVSRPTLHNLPYPKNMDIIFFIIIFSMFLLQKCAFLKYFGGGGIACLPTFPLLKMRFIKQQTNYFLKAYRLSELNFFLLLKVANIRCFILIAVEIVHNIIHKQPRTKEIRHCFIFLNPVKNPMFTRTIFIRPDSELIRESVCTCAKLFVDEESTWHKSNRGRTNTLTDSIRKRHKKEDSASFV